MAVIMNGPWSESIVLSHNTSNVENLGAIFVRSLQNVSDVAPSALLTLRAASIREVLTCIEKETTAAYAERRLRQIFADPNWVLDPRMLESVTQLVGEVQFWMMARELGVDIERVPESDDKTPDFCLVSGSKNVRFEVKTLSVADGLHNLNSMSEDSYQAQLDLMAQRAEGKRVAIALTEIAPHGKRKPQTGMMTGVCRRLIDKTVQNIKIGQYRGAPTLLVINLMVIDGYFTGNAALRPVFPGYPHPRSVQTGPYWTLAFGYMDQAIHVPPEFEGKPGIEGTLDRIGVLSNPEFSDVLALLLVIHPWQQPPYLGGLIRSKDQDAEFAEVFFALTRKNWNDEVDSNGFALDQP